MAIDVTKYIARYGAMRTLGIFTFPENTPLRHGMRILLRTRRGQEAGIVLRAATEEVLTKFDAATEDKIIRVMTRTDELEDRKIKKGEKAIFDICKRIMAEMKMPMELIRIEHIFGGERVVVYYVAEGRIDFRDLVKALAAELQTRIEMRQVGVRDETRLLADCGDCGREVCCNSHIMEMLPVSMKMAKLQRATLDPTKISGRCGRLKCCLRYEYDLYCDFQNELPGIGKRIETPDGVARVVAHEILPQRVIVDLGKGTTKTYAASEITYKKSTHTEQDESEDNESELDDSDSSNNSLA